MKQESFCKKALCFAMVSTLTVYATARITDCWMHHFFQYCSAYLHRGQSASCVKADLEEAAQEMSGDGLPLTQAD